MRLVPILHGPKRLAAALVFASLGAGCADAVDKSHARLRPWLDERPRSMVVTLNPKPPEAKLVERDSRVIAGLKGFAAGALVGALAPWVGGGGFPDAETAAAVTIIFSAEGAIAGTVIGAWDPDESLAPIEDEPALARLLEGRRFERMLQSRVVALGAESSRHRLRAARPDETKVWDRLPNDVDVAVGLGFRRFGFLREGADSPRFAFYIRGTTTIARQWTGPEARTWPQGVAIRRWKYTGQARSASEWTANDGALFDREMARAVEKLAEEIVGGLGVREEEESASAVPGELAAAD